MSEITQKPIIAIDGDGVMLDYKSGYAHTWEVCFGDTLSVQNPSYHATTHFGVTNPDKAGKFWRLFEEHGWVNMKPEPHALDACLRLAEAGYRLVCVTAIPAHCADKRLQNLRELGFPIDDVIATGMKGEGNPKKAVLDQLAPEWFIDDEAKKLKDLSCKTILINPPYHDSPNANEDLGFVDHVVVNLKEASDRILSTFTQKIRF